LYVIGLGPGDPELITIKAARILSNTKLVFVPYSQNTGRSLALEIINKYVNPRAEVIPIGFPMKKEVDERQLKTIAEEICKKLIDGSVFAVLGDPMLYSTFFRINKYINCANVEFVPGVSSITACASRISLPMASGDDAIAIVPSTRLDVIKEANKKFETIIILKSNENIDIIVNQLNNNYKLYYLKRCFMNDEKIIELKDLTEIIDRDYFSMIIARRYEK
jgi:precorrin-2/cobalt-factor-2 C20-methyltransferase